MPLRRFQVSGLLPVLSYHASERKPSHLMTALAKYITATKPLFEVTLKKAPSLSLHSLMDQINGEIDAFISCFQPIVDIEVPF